LSETEYLVIFGNVKHIGDKPQSIGGEGTFVGSLFEARFDLPDNVDIGEEAVIQCRIKHNEIDNKKFLVNFHPLDKILKPHPENKDEWLQDIAVISKGILTPGENVLCIGYADERIDDFMVDNVVLWYKRRKDEGFKKNAKDIDSLDHLSSVEELY
jgi:hypothetical protein